MKRIKLREKRNVSNKVCFTNRKGIVEGYITRIELVKKFSFSRKTLYGIIGFITDFNGKPQGWTDLECSYNINELKNIAERY